MLTLDQTTLYYHFLSNSAPNGNNGEKFLSGINNWAASIPRNAKPASKAATTSTKATSGGSLLSPLTEATTSSASSVLTKNISISHKSPVNVKLEADDDAFNSIGGGLSDEDETNGIERDAVVASSLKGKKCATSAVSNFFHFAFHLI
jgi:hypothetical protein